MARFDIAVEQHGRASRLSVSPKTETRAVGVDEIGQRLEFGPLRLVMFVGEFARVAALAGRLDPSG
jgi:hypothetical protein